jgi:hypothetical protein
MSIASTILSAAFNSLLAINGEALTYRGASVTALVDRYGYRGTEKQPDFAARNMCRIEILKSAVSPAPIAREVFTDADGFAHAIQTFKATDICYICECKTSTPSVILTDADGSHLTDAGGAKLTT